MDNIVKITGSKSGIILRLDPEADWDSIVKDVAEKFKSSAEFWGMQRKQLHFRGASSMRSSRMKSLQRFRITVSFRLCACLMRIRRERLPLQRLSSRRNQEVRLRWQRKLQPICFRTIMAPVSFSREIFVPVRCWMLRRALSFWEMSDNGAKVISKGNVIILGSLKGNVFAGSAGNVDAFVIALDMKPVQIRIADTIARSPDESPRRSKTKETKIAFWEDGNIYIEPLDKDVMSDIRLS